MVDHYYYGSLGQRDTDLAGRVMMLQRKETVEHRFSESAFSGIPDGIFNHPVIVLSRKPLLDGVVAVLIVTSFNETPIQVRHVNPQTRKSYLPIHPAEHPDTADVLTIADGKMLRKLSYVNVKDVHQLPLFILSEYWGAKDLCLERESYRTMVQAVWQDNVAVLSSHSIGARPARVHQSASGRHPVLSKSNRTDQVAIPQAVLSNGPLLVSGYGVRSMTGSQQYGTFLSSTMAAAASREPTYAYVAASNTRPVPASARYHAIIPPMPSFVPARPSPCQCASCRPFTGNGYYMNQNASVAQSTDPSNHDPTCVIIFLALAILLILYLESTH